MPLLAHVSTMLLTWVQMAWIWLSQCCSSLAFVSKDIKSSTWSIDPCTHTSFLYSLLRLDANAFIWPSRGKIYWTINSVLRSESKMEAEAANVVAWQGALSQHHKENTSDALHHEQGSALIDCRKGDFSPQVDSLISSSTQSALPCLRVLLAAVQALWSRYCCTIWRLPRGCALRQPFPGRCCHLGWWPSGEASSSGRRSPPANEHLGKAWKQGNVPLVREDIVWCASLSH